MSKLVFSIVIACYNQEDFVRTAVESALFQSFKSKEVIVVDDGSRDKTGDVLETFGDSITLARLKVNGGASAARNHGASLARGQYVVFLDGDDALLPWALEVYGRLVEDRAPTLLLGRCHHCYGEIPKTPALPDRIQFVEYPNFLAKDRPHVYNSSTLVVNRAQFESAGGWSPDIFYQDIQDLINKLAVAGPTILVDAPETVWYRMHSTNAVSKVVPFVEGMYKLLAKAKAGVYPGGREYWLQRTAWFGGLIFYWSNAAMQAGHYLDALRLLRVGWWMVLLALLRRSSAWIMGRKSIETMPFVRNAYAVGKRVESTPMEESHVSGKDALI